MTRRPCSPLATLLALAFLVPPPVSAAAADRAVAWLAADGRLERDLNQLAARGLRLAAVSDGLPQPVVAMQAPDGDAAPAEYRVVSDKDLPAALQSLVDDGFVPVASAQRTNSRTLVIFERAGAARIRATWTLVQFGDLDALEGALASAAADGFRARLLVQTPLKSWPGLSHGGLLLASKGSSSDARDVRLVVHRSRNVDEAAKALASAAGEGFEFDLLFSSTRDGAVEGRRDRLVIALSRGRGAAKTVPPVLVERNTSFGTWGKGAPRGAAPFWDEDYVHAWSPGDRQQTWASPISLSDSDARGVGIELKLRVDGMDEQTSDIVGLVARPFMKEKYYLMVLTDQWMGPKPKR